MSKKKKKKNCGLETFSPGHFLKHGGLEGLFCCLKSVKWMLVQITGQCGRMVFRLANYTFQFERLMKKSKQGLGSPSWPRGRDGWCERRDSVQKQNTLLRIRANSATFETLVVEHFKGENIE